MQDFFGALEQLVVDLHRADVETALDGESVHVVDLGVASLNFELAIYDHVNEALQHTRWQLQHCLEVFEGLLGLLQEVECFVEVVGLRDKGPALGTEKVLVKFRSLLQKILSVYDILDSLKGVIGVLDDELEALWVVEVVLVHCFV